MAPFLITIFGAGGKTGQQCVKSALARGDNVRAVVREVNKYESELGKLAALSSSSSPSSGKEKAGSLEVVAGDVEASPESLKELLSGASAAIFAASASKTGDVWKVDRDGLGNLAAAAKETPGLERVVAISSALVTPHNGWHPIRLLLNNMRGGSQKIMDAKFAGENLLRGSGVSYVVVRPGGLQDGEALGASSLVVSQGDKSGAGRISRSDVAELCVAAAHAHAEGEEEGALRLTLEVSSDPKKQKDASVSYESLLAKLEKDA